MSDFIVKGGKVVELADPSDIEGEKEQDIAEPEEDIEPEKAENPGENSEEDSPEVPEKTFEEESATEVSEEKTTPEGSDKKKEQTADERRAEAAARRAREKASIDAAIKAARDEAFRTAYIGRPNPYTGKPILNEADAIEYQKHFEVDQLNNKLKSGQLDAQTINKLIEQSPAVLELKETNRKLEAERGDIGLQKAIEEIHLIDGDINSVDDLLESPNAERFKELVSENKMNLVEAYKLANFDKLLERKTAAAKQAAINQVNGKSHLKSTNQKGTPQIEVPDDVYRQYKALNPDATRAEIEAHYRKHH